MQSWNDRLRKTADQTAQREGLEKNVTDRLIHLFRQIWEIVDQKELTPEIYLTSLSNVTKTDVACGLLDHLTNWLNGYNNHFLLDNIRRICRQSLVNKVRQLSNRPQRPTAQN